MKQQNIQAGVGKAVLQLPDELFPMEKLYGVHDNLHTRVIIFHQTNYVVLVSLELTSLRSYEIERLKAMITRYSGFSHATIWISVTHTFNAPHTRSKEALEKASDEIKRKNTMLCDKIEQSVACAFEEALASIDDVHIYYGLGKSKINGNRDVETRDGWWLGLQDDGYSDHEIPIICMKNDNKKDIAMIINYDIQSSIMDGSVDPMGKQFVSSDLGGAICKEIERETGAIVMFCPGAAGDQAPIFQAVQTEILPNGALLTHDRYELGYQFIELLGKRFASCVYTVLHKLKLQQENQIQARSNTMVCHGQSMPKDRKELVPTRAYEYKEAQNQETPIELITLGELALVGVQPEIASHMGSLIKQQSPFELTLVVTMVNGGAKYMAEKESYVKCCYEAMNSPFAIGSGEQLVSEVVDLLTTVYKENRR